MAYKSQLVLAKLLFHAVAILILGCKEQISQPQADNLSNRPNVIFIAIDDLRPELGAYGNSIIHTPNIDRLAASGLVFNKHYVQVPTCGASRYTLMTGYRPKAQIHLENEVFYKEMASKEENEQPESFVHQLRRNGYYTLGIGKLSHSADGFVYDYTDAVSTKKEMPYSWNEFDFNAGKWGTGWNAFFAYADGENRQSRQNQVKPYEAANVDDLGYPDGLTAQLALEKLRFLKNQKQPFFLGIGFFKPHLPFNAPKKYWDLYDREKIPIAPNPTIPEGTTRASLHHSGEFNSYHLTDEKPSLDAPLSDAYSRKLTHAYYASISYIDAQIGKITTELKTLELDKNTIIVVWGDHGWHLGNHRVWGKHTLFDTALRSALIIKVPSNTAGTTNAIVETVDLYPTILDLCGVPWPHEVDGKSFKGLFLDKNDSQKEVAYSYFKNGISMRNERYRLTKYYRNDETVIELYDYENDPFETKNWATETPEIVEELLPVLMKGDTGLYN